MSFTDRGMDECLYWLCLHRGILFLFPEFIRTYSEFKTWDVSDKNPIDLPNGGLLRSWGEVGVGMPMIFPVFLTRLDIWALDWTVSKPASDTVP